MVESNLPSNSFVLLQNKVFSWGCCLLQFKSRVWLIKIILQADKAFWQSVKEFQERVKLDEKISEEIIRESTRAEVETHLEKAIECQKRRGRVRDLSELVKVNSFEQVSAQNDFWSKTTFQGFADWGLHEFTGTFPIEMMFHSNWPCLSHFRSVSTEIWPICFWYSNDFQSNLE